MCGLSGYLMVDNSTKSTREISEMIALHSHRGPDDSGLLGINMREGALEPMSPNSSKSFSRPADLLFGFNRLSILDLSINGHQPMLSPDGNVVLMMNGEVYNAFDYKDDLIRKGHHFKGTSDTEVVLHLYLEYGMDEMIRMLNGMFALAIYDARNKRLFLARDRFGIKPLYIMSEPGRLAFSSEMKSFKALPGFRFELDPEMLDEFLIFRNVVNRTLFKKIWNCEPGTYLAISPDGEIKNVTFYDINEEGSQPLAKDEACDKLENSLRKGVHSQMISDVKLGCQLSGGVDSSLVTKYASDHLEDGQLETISIVFDNPRFSEKEYVDRVSSQLNLQSHQYLMDAAYYFDAMETATWHFEQPLNHPNTIGIYLLSQEARNHVTVLLSGEGADETLAGYSHFVQLSQNPFFKRHFLGKLKQNRDHGWEYLRHYSDPDSRMVMAPAFGNLSTAYALKKDFGMENALSIRRNVLTKLDGETLLKQRKYEMLTYLPDLLMRQDKMSMAHSIENRVPFLDNDMVSTSFNVHRDQLIGRRNGRLEAKLLLKQICAARFDEDFAFRDKMGFGIPLREFMASDRFRDKWHSQIAPGIKKRGVFNFDNVHEWYQDMQSAGPVHLDAIWLMTGFELWAQSYLD